MPSSTSSSDAGADAAPVVAACAAAAGATRRRAPAGLLLGLLLFAAGEYALWSSDRVVRLAARHTPAGPDGDPLIVEWMVRSLPRAREADATPVLLLGSSQVREGLDCAVFEARLPGRACRNLAISAGSPLDVLEIADRLDRRAPRRVTVLGLFPKVLHLDPKESFVGGSTFACVLASGAWARLSARQWTGLAAGLLERASPTLRFKDGLREAYGVARRDPRAAWRLELPPAPQRLLAGQPPLPEVYFARRVGVRDADARPPGAFTPAQERALERFLDRERRRGNPALVIDFPTRPGYETTLPPETRAHYAALLERLRARPGLVFVPAAELGPLAPSDFQDFTHLSEAGRARVSARAAERLRAALAATRSPAL